MVKKLVSLLIFYLTISTCIGQTSPNTPSGYSIDYTSGNLVPYDSSLKTNNGWSSTTGGPTWAPYGSPQGSFNATDGYTFSFPIEELGVAGINLGGFPHGYLNTNAVFVTGFSYGLTYRFPCANTIGGYCEDPKGAQDTLRVEIGYYPASGAPTFLTHQLGLKNINDGNSPYNPTWQTLAETYTFAGAKTLSQAGAVNMGIIGQDAGGWACIGSTCYGPQVKDAYIKANYSVDPCILNPAFSPNCPGFNNVVQGAQSFFIWNSYNIATSLPHIGGGVQLHGYEYGFNWTNYGSCYNTFLFWCTDWRTDGGGGINLRVSDKANNTLFYDRQYREGNNASGSYYNRFLFSESRNSLDMGYVQWWADSVWNNIAFSGWTRPIWTPDPCYSQPLYSPNCSNFQDEINRIAAEQKAIQDAQLATTVSSVSTTPTSSITTTVNDATTTNPTVTVTTVETDPIKTTTSSTSQQTALVSSAVTTETPTTRTGARPVISVSDNTSFALSLVNRNAERESTIANQASRNAIDAASNVASASMKQAENIALDAVEKSKSSDLQENQNQSIVANSNSRQNTMLPMGAEPQNTSVVTAAIQQRNTNNNFQIEQQTASSTSTTAIVQFNAMQVTNVQDSQTFNAMLPPAAQIQNNNTTVTMYQPPVQNVATENKAFTFQQQERSMVSTESIILNNPTMTEQTNRNIAIATTLLVTQVETTATPSNFLTDRSNPMNQILEQKPIGIETNSRSNTNQTVKSNVQDNDAAGGVSINSIAVTPVGFNAYNIALKDVAFYAPKEIYRGQKTIDNARALRQLASDKLHQQMVDQQYRR
jgi:hypothetical protein